MVWKRCSFQESLAWLRKLKLELRPLPHRDSSSHANSKRQRNAGRVLGFIQGPCGRGELGEAVDGRIGEAGKYSSQVIAYGDVDAAASFNDGEDGGDLGSGLLAANVDPVFAT